MVEIEVCGFKVRAETDFAPATSSGTADAEALKCASFIRLCNEARTIAKEYINAKFKSDMICAALAAPPRNCDVGTAQEQDERFHRFCVKHHTGSCAGCHNPVGDYTVANGVRECALVWAQLSYEEGGAK